MRKKTQKILPLLFIALLFVVSSCTDDDALVNNSLSTIKVSTGALYPEFDPEIKDYYITSINTLNTIEVTLNDYDASKTIYINNRKVTTKTTQLHLNPGEDIVVRFVKSPNETTTYTIHYLPEDLPEAHTITQNNPAEGYILINMFELTATGPKEYSYIAILNNEGFPVYYKKLPYKAVINFKYFETIDNKKRFSYSINDTGKTVIMNEKFEILQELALLPYNGHGSYPIDNHDFIYLNDNHYILPGIITRENVDMTAYGGSNAVDLVEVVIQEILNNQVVFEWNSANYPELLAATDPVYYAQYATNPKVDYFHFNSLSIDPNDQNFIVSARHTNQLYKINRTSGEIMWRFGGSSDNFNLSGNEIISHPHHATILPNGRLLVFDNGVTKTPKQTRIAEFEIDPINSTANLTYEYFDIGRYFDIMGSVQKLDNGNYFIGWGGNVTSQVNANKSDITEINANGTVVLDISFTNNPNSFTYSYRALKYNIHF